MQKKYWIIGIIILVILVSLFMFRGNKSEQVYFNKVDVESSNYITNTANKKYIDTILAVGLKELNIKNTQVTVNYMPSGSLLKGTDVEIRAFILNKSSQYAIYIVDASREATITIVAHELIHYKQYYDKRLLVEGDNITWEGKDYTNYDAGYETNPWEREAFGKAKDLENIILSKLYNKK